MLKETLKVKIFQKLNDNVINKRKTFLENPNRILVMYYF